MIAAFVATLSIAVYLLPLLYVVYRVLTAPLRTWYPLLAFAAVLAAIQMFAEYGGAEFLLVVMYYLAGAV